MLPARTTERETLELLPHSDQGRSLRLSMWSKMLPSAKGLFGGKRRQPWSEPFSPEANASDIFHCFRLLLGRHPQREEWAGHSMRVGEDLRSVVSSYLGSLEFSRRHLLDPEGMRSLELTELSGFRIFAAASDAAVGHHLRRDDYEPDVTAVFRRILEPGMGVLDLGANIGYFTMLSASIVGPAGHVTAVEPNPRNARLIEASRRANGFEHVRIAQVAAGRELGMLSLNASFSNGTTSDLAPALNGLLDAETVPCLPADLLIPAGRRVDLVKVDVEGAEYNALLGCSDLLARDHPILVSEFSPSQMPGISGVEGEAYLRWIVEKGYDLSVVQPDGSLTSPTSRVPEIMAAYVARGSDHIDMVAMPTGCSPVRAGMIRPGWTSP